MVCMCAVDNQQTGQPHGIVSSTRRPFRCRLQPPSGIDEAVYIDAISNGSVSRLREGTSNVATLPGQPLPDARVGRVGHPYIHLGCSVVARCNLRSIAVLIRIEHRLDVEVSSGNRSVRMIGQHQRHGRGVRIATVRDSSSQPAREYRQTLLGQHPADQLRSIQPGNVRRRQRHSSSHPSLRIHGHLRIAARRHTGSGKTQRRRNIGTAVEGHRPGGIATGCQATRCGQPAG